MIAYHSIPTQPLFIISQAAALQPGDASRLPPPAALPSIVNTTPPRSSILPPSLLACRPPCLPAALPSKKFKLNCRHKLNFLITAMSYYRESPSYSRRSPARIERELIE